MPVRASGQGTMGLLIGCSLALAAGCCREPEAGGKIGPFDAFDDAQVPFAEGPHGPEQAAATVEVKEHGFAPLSETLGILVEEATFELTRPAKSILVRTDVFHKGAYVNSSTRVSGLTVEEPATSGRIAIHLIDADYLPVGDAAENTYQIRLSHSFDDLKGRVGLRSSQERFRCEQVTEHARFQAERLRLARRAALRDRRQFGQHPFREDS